MDIAERIHRCGALAVVSIEEAARAVPLARALVEGGVDAMEITLRTPAALDALRAIAAEVPGMHAGAGTILRPEQAAEAREAGARFGVSPGINRRVVERAARERLWFAPGVMTPSDVEHALELDCRVLKFFPAGAVGGLEYLEAMAAPYAHLGVKFIALGGVNEENLRRYLSHRLIHAVGGTWLAPHEAIERGDWKRVENNARRARQVVDALRA